MTSRNHGRIAAAAIATLLLFHQSAGATVEPPSPASGHAAVVAQGVVGLADGPFHWQVTIISVTATLTPIDATVPTLVISNGPAALVVNGAAGPLARLAAGEAFFLEAGEPAQVQTLSPSGGTAIVAAIVPGPGDTTNTFTPGPSSRDVDLVRDVLSTNEVLLVHADVSALVMVTAGAVSAGGATVGAGSSLALTGEVALINTAPETATVFVALVGPTLGDVVIEVPTSPPPASQTPTPATNPPATAPPADNPPGTTEGPPDTTPETTLEPTPPTTTEPEPEPDPTLDSDGDGLRDTDEAGFGSDPFDSDTDNDGLTDGADRGSGCSPTSYDTDGDGFSDGSEVNAGTNCAVAGMNG